MSLIHREILLVQLEQDHREINQDKEENPKGQEEKVCQMNDDITEKIDLNQLHE